MQNPLAMRADLVRDLLTGFVFHSDDNFHANQFQSFEREARREAGGAPGIAVSALRASNPIAEVAEMIERMNLAETQSAEEGLGLRLGDRKTVITALVPARLRQRDPVARFPFLIIVMR